MEDDQVTIETVNQIFREAKRQADKTFKARVAADEIKKRLIDAEREAAATAQRFGATDPRKIQEAVLSETRIFREDSETAARAAIEEGHRLQLVHYELDRVRTIIDLMKMRPEG